MFKNMKLGTKIALGFGLLIALACLLGGLAVVNMKKAQAQSNMLAYEYVPEVDLAGSVTMATQKMMLGMRSYALSEDEKYLTEGQKNLAETKKWIAECQTLSEKAAHLTKLKDGVQACNQSIAQYEQLANKTVEENRTLGQNRQKLDAAAQEMMKSTAAFLAAQNDAFKKDLAERQQMIRLASDMVSSGMNVRALSLKGQAQGKLEMMEQALTQLDAVSTAVTQLRPITKDADDTQKIEQMDKAIKAQRTVMVACLAEQKKGAGADQAQLEKLRQEMDAAIVVLDNACDEFLTGQYQKLDTDMTERHHKLALINEVIELGNSARLACFKSQALNDAKLMRDAEANFPKIDEKLEEVRKITRVAEDLQAIDKTKTAAQAYKTEMLALLANLGDVEQLTVERGKVGDLLIQATDDLSTAGTKNATAVSQASAQSLSVSSTVMVIGLVIALVVGIVVAIFITRSITGPIRRIIDSLNEGSEQVSSASGQVSAASQSLAEGATEQAAGLEETSSSLEEMSSMTKQNADNAQQANTLATEARKAATTGSDSMGRMNQAILDIQKSSDETAKIIKVIDEIAFQTNLLALNAAVEAARAGEAGKGFAVVAEEVRNLAMRSAEAAKNTARMIEESVKNSKNGVDIATEVSKVLEEIVGSVGKTTDLVSEIAAASQEQAQGIDQVNTAVAQMDKVTQQNAANAEESASASEELSAQAESMKEVVGQLVALVGGAGSQTAHSGGPKKTEHHLHVNLEHKAPKAEKAAAKSHTFGKSDEAFHKIASHPQAKHTPAAKVIPLDKSEHDLESFNN